MQRQSWTMVAVLIAVVALIGLIVALRSHEGGAPKTITQTKTETTAPRAVEEQPSPNEPFAFRRLEIDTSRQVGEACLVFNDKLDESGAVHYADYIAIDPTVSVNARVDGQRLCLAGLTFGKDYQATLKAGLPGIGGKKLAGSETVPVSLRDRPPFVGFGQGTILPRVSSDGLPISTVNVARVEIEVSRVNDRLLSQLQSYVIDERQIYGYERNTYTDEQGRSIWKGTMDILDTPNQTVTTVFPLRKALKDRTPGVYLVTARDTAKRDGVGDNGDDWAGRASQWVVETDLGLTSYRGEGGLSVFVRSLATAEPVEGVNLAIVSRDNAELTRVTTDRNGRADVPAALMRGTGGAEPVVVMAYGKDGDFSYLDLRRSSFDLSDRGVSGRTSPGAVDAWLYTERGVYRPGETVHLVLSLRDHLAAALPTSPVTLIIRRPDGLEFKRQQAGPFPVGLGNIDVGLTDSAPRGRWSASAYTDVDASPVGSVEFDVQDFVPERLKLTLMAPAAVLKPGGTIELPFAARFLYGAPASGLQGEADYRLAPQDKPFAGYEDYHFGPADADFSPSVESLSVDAADAEGKGNATGVLPADLTSSTPLEAQFRVSLFEPGGRMTTENTSLPVRAKDVYVGVKGNFSEDSVPENSAAKFSVVVLDAQGRSVAKDLDFSFIREDVDYQWYQVDGEWRYDTVTREKLLEAGKVSAVASVPAALTQNVEWGRYRLTVKDAASGAETSFRFYAGWGASGSEDRPDRLPVVSDKPSYKVGEDVALTIRPPLEGKALVVIASDHILTTKLVDVPAGGTDVRFKVDRGWGTGAYALVSFYRALDDKVAQRAPARAIGVAWLAVDSSEQTLQVAIDAPMTVRPRTKLDVPVTITNAQPGEAIRMTLAAVDEGILQLTDYKSPSATDYYFGKRRLGVDIRDDYGRLIEAQGAVGPIREGGDGLGGRALSAVPTRTVALFSGVVDIGKGGKAVVPLDIPDFVGELRLMAVAASAARLGQGEKPLTVRDQVVADLSLPRFLAPGDKAEATLIIDNVEGPDGTYRATIGASGAVAADKAPPIEAAVKPKQRMQFAVPLTAQKVGLATITLALEGPNGFKISRAWPIEVRAPALEDYRQTVASLKPQEEARLDAKLLDGLRPETSALTVSVAGVRGYDVPALLKWLDRYPFGCIEQTTSRAMPLLYVKDIGPQMGLADENALHARVQDSVERVVDMQSPYGGFGMWSARSNTAEPWISVFAIDFLVEAKAQNYVVPDAALKTAYEWLRGTAGRDDYPKAVRAYALYVLARAGAVSAGDVRYFYDTSLADFTDAAGPGFAAAALSALGDKARAADGFKRATELAHKATLASYTPVLYGSLLRDVAAVTALAAQSGAVDVLPDLMNRVAELEPPVEYTTTQEKAWLVRGASALEKLKTAVAVDVKGTEAKKVAGRFALAPSPGELATGVSLTNTGAQPVWWTATATGVPAVVPPPSASGFTITKTYYTLDGNAVNLAQVQQSDRFVVSISGQAEDNLFRTVAVLDLLPAGFEVEATVLPLEDGSSAYAFLDKLTTTSVAEGRDDRFVAAFELGDRYPDPEGKRAKLKPTYHVAYVVRAVTPGSYVVPGAQVEDMYRPQMRARGSASHLGVIAAK